MAIGNLPIGSAYPITGTGQVKTGFGAIVGFFCSSSTSGTLTVYDSASGASNQIVASFPLVAGQYYPLPFALANGLYAVVGGAATGTFSAV